MTLAIKLFKNSRIARIEALLTANGPMTRAELAEAGLPKAILGSVLSRLAQQNGPQSPQRIHIHDWTDEHPGERAYPRAIYALGPGENKKKPKARDHRERSKSYQQAAKTAVASVFELGAHVKVRIAMTRQRRAVARQL